MSKPFSDPRSLQPPPDLTGRAEAKAAFLTAAGLADRRREPVAGDASTRAYERLHAPDGSTLILMDAPPAAESATAGPDASPQERIARGYNAMARLAGGRTDAFAAVAGWLRAQGLSAPAVVEVDAAAGFAVLEDLGDRLFVHRLAAGEDAAAVYGAAVDLLVALQREPPPASLPAPGRRRLAAPALRRPGAAHGRGSVPGVVASPRRACRRWTRRRAPSGSRCGAPCWSGARRARPSSRTATTTPRTCSGCPSARGAARVGLLDFQDAVRGHPAWDLLSLLQDARRDVAPELEAAMQTRFLAGRPELDREAFLADYAALGALNAARILGPVFARQIVLFGRDKYRAFLPRTWRALERDLSHPGTADLKRWFDRHIPTDRRA